MKMPPQSTHRHSDSDRRHRFAARTAKLLAGCNFMSASIAVHKTSQSQLRMKVVGGRNKVNYFSRSITKSGTHSRARLNSESGKEQIALRAASEYCAAAEFAASTEPYLRTICSTCSSEMLR